MATAQPASPPPSYQSVTAATAFDEPAILATNSDSEDDGYIDVLNASSGERTSTAWVEGKTHRSLRQSVSEEIEAELKRQRLPSVQEGDVDPFNTPGDDDNLAWHDNDEFDNEDDDDDDENDGNDDNDSSDASTDAKPKEQDSTPADSKRRQYLKPDTSSDDQSMFVQVENTYSAIYHGAAAFPDGDDRKIESYAERAAGYILTQPLGASNARRCKVTVTNEYLQLRKISMKKGRPQIQIHLSTLRCFSLHRDRHLKPKFVSVMALRSAQQRRQHPGKPYACYLVHFNKTAEAASFMAVMKLVCRQQLKESGDEQA